MCFPFLSSKHEQSESAQFPLSSSSVAIDSFPGQIEIMAASLPEPIDVSSSNQTPNRSNFFLNILPLELRELIYTEYILLHPHTYHISKECKVSETNQRPTGITNLLCTNSQINEEVAPIVRKYIPILIPNLDCKNCTTDTNIRVPICFRTIAFQTPLSPAAIDQLQKQQQKTTTTISCPLPHTSITHHLGRQHVSTNPNYNIHLNKSTLPFILWSLGRARHLTFEFTPTPKPAESSTKPVSLGSGRRVTVTIDAERNIQLEGLARAFVEKVREELFGVLRLEKEDKMWEWEGRKITETWRVPKQKEGPRVRVIDEDGSGSEV